EVYSDKRVSYISDSEGSYLDAVSTAFRPEVKIVYNKLLKETKNLPDNKMQLADLIEVKGMKAQGNQLTKLKVKEIVLTHPIDEGKEPWPENSIEETGDTEKTSDDATTMEWEITNEASEDNDDPNEDDEEQLKLF
ncbi:MAG: DNA gyrase/topoisomerase IV subunit A, partial [Flavobacteriia bacterium]|nr:DNA gyrase/topoisomerase IV subunit A [Flavobacteriia bacterium]